MNIGKKKKKSNDEILLLRAYVVAVEKYRSTRICIYYYNQPQFKQFQFRRKAKNVMITVALLRCFYCFFLNCFSLFLSNINEIWLILKCSIFHFYRRHIIEIDRYNDACNIVLFLDRVIELLKSWTSFCFFNCTTVMRYDFNVRWLIDSISVNVAC